jgi:hypothetical protein
MIPWDLDLTWGNRQKTEADLYDVPPDENVLSDDGPLHQVLVNGDPEIKNEIVGKYQTLRADAWSDEKVGGLLDRLEAQIYTDDKVDALRRELQAATAAQAVFNATMNGTIAAINAQTQNLAKLTGTIINAPAMLSSEAAASAFKANGASATSNG